MFINNHLPQIIQSAVVLICLLLLRGFFIILVKRFAKKSERLDLRTGLIIKHIDFAVIFILVFAAVLIWGVNYKDVGIYMSSVFAVIGIGFFAQWSILSNITSGVIMFFTFPYKIGDYIKIHDKDYPYEGYIEDIKAFHIIIHTQNNEIITYPNSMMLQKGVTVIRPNEIEEYLHPEEEINTTNAID